MVVFVFDSDYESALFPQGGQPKVNFPFDPAASYSASHLTSYKGYYLSGVSRHRKRRHVIAINAKERRDNLPLISFENNIYNDMI